MRSRNLILKTENPVLDIFIQSKRGGNNEKYKEKRQSLIKKTAPKLVEFSAQKHIKTPKPQKEVKMDVSSDSSYVDTFEKFMAKEKKSK